MTGPVRPFRGVSAADRLAQRRADLLDAGLKEIGEVGVINLRMNTVCERAGLTQRYFYEHFKNRDELIGALFDAMVSDFVARTLEAIEVQPLDLWSRAHAGIDVFLDMLNNDPHRARLLAEAASFPALTERRNAGVRLCCDLVTAQAEAALGRADAKARTRIYSGAYLVIMGQVEASLAWRRGEIPLSRSEYVDLVATTFVAALEAAHTSGSEKRV